jgi:hypothetical protein
MMLIMTIRSTLLMTTLEYYDYALALVVMIRRSLLAAVDRSLCCKSIYLLSLLSDGTIDLIAAVAVDIIDSSLLSTNLILAVD